MDMRKVGPLLLLVITALLLANGVALATTTQCSNSSDPLSNLCVVTALTSDGSGSKIRYPDNSAVLAQPNQSHP
jgi:hypothetical protein